MSECEYIYIYIYIYIYSTYCRHRVSTVIIAVQDAALDSRDRARLFTWHGWKMVLSESTLDHIAQDSAQHIIVVQRAEPLTSRVPTAEVAEEEVAAATAASEAGGGKGAGVTRARVEVVRGSMTAARCMESTSAHTICKDMYTKRAERDGEGGGKVGGGEELKSTLRNAEYVKNLFDSGMYGFLLRVNFAEEGGSEGGGGEGGEGGEGRGVGGGKHFVMLAFSHLPDPHTALQPDQIYPVLQVQHVSGGVFGY